MSGHDPGVELEVQDLTGALSQAGNETALTDPGSNGDNNDVELKENEFDGADIDNGVEPESDEESLEEADGCTGDKSTGGGTSGRTDYDCTGDDSTGSDTDDECEGQEQSPKTRKRIKKSTKMEKKQAY